MYPCQNKLLECYKSSSDFKDELDAWREYACLIKEKTHLIRNDRDLKSEVLYKFCVDCEYNRSE